MVAHIKSHDIQQVYIYMYITYIEYIMKNIYIYIYTHAHDISCYIGFRASAIGDWGRRFRVQGGGA